MKLRQTGIIIFSLLLITQALLVRCRETPDDYQGKPKETITLERAREMYQAYQPRYDTMSAFLGMDDAQSGWHSLDFYKRYIAYLEYEAKKVGIKVSGLRLYYAAYPNDSTSGDQANYQTYLYVPTYYDEKTKKHVAFDPLHIDSNGIPLPIHDIITGDTRGRMNRLFTAAYAAAQESSIANMGEMCKPNCGL